MRMPRLPILLPLLISSALAVASDCAIPLPKEGATVEDYLRQTNRSDEKSLAAQVHSALYDLVEYSPMGCGDAEPDDAYTKFRIRHASRDDRQCAWLRLGIVPPGASAERPPTPVVCAPASSRVGGWACKFLPVDLPRTR